MQKKLGGKKQGGEGQQDTSPTGKALAGDLNSAKSPTSYSLRGVSHLRTGRLWQGKKEKEGTEMSKPTTLEERELGSKRDW